MISVMHRARFLSRPMGAAASTTPPTSIALPLLVAPTRRPAGNTESRPQIGNHTFRATGITAYLSNGGTLDHAQQITAYDCCARCRTVGDGAKLLEAVGGV